MKNIPVPYLRSLLLLALFVGLLGVAKILLLNKVENMKEPSAGLSKRTSAGFSQKTSAGISQSNSAGISQGSGTSSAQKYVWSSGTLAKPSSWTFASSRTTDSLPDESTTQDVSNSIHASPAIASVEGRVEEKVEVKIEKIVVDVKENSLKENVEDSPIRISSFFQDHLAMQAELRLQSDVTYDGRYLKIGYPMGDVPENIGVCTDVVIRSFRGLGIDLQQRVHEDMKRNFRSYPNNWQLSKPDTNIDHRRVPNLMTYFERSGASLKVTKNPSDYAVGDIVTWDLGYGLTHIGIVSNYVSELTGNPLIVHNIGEGPELNDMLFKYKITGHYNYGDAVSDNDLDSNKVPSQDLAKTILESLDNNLEGFVYIANE